MSTRIRFVLCFTLSIWCFQARGGDFPVGNTDSAGFGFKDQTAAVPLGDNTGTTLGEQRTNALEKAAQILSVLIHNDLPIEISASFGPLGCGPDAPLYQAGPQTAAANWSQGTQPQADTWYPIPLANTLAESDLNGGNPEIIIIFNSDLPGNCSAGQDWYLGLDGQAGSQIDFVTVALEAIIQGLGFHTFTNLETGAFLFADVDIFADFLEDDDSGILWNAMSSGQRAASAIDEGNLRWKGNNLNNSATGLTTGRNGDGEVEIFARSPLDIPAFSQGDINSRPMWFGDSLDPGELLQRGYAGVNHNPGLALELLYDLGYEARKNADLSLALDVDNDGPLVGDTIHFTLTITNDGPGGADRFFIRNLFAPGLSFQSVSGSGNFDSGTGILEIQSLAKNTSTTTTFTVLVTETGNLYCESEIIASQIPDPDSTPNNSNSGEDDYARRTLTGIATIGNGDLLTDLGGAQNSWRYYKFTVPAGKEIINIRTFGGRGNLDLYLRYNEVPDLDNWDERPLINGNSEWINIRQPAGGDWYIGIHGYQSYEDSAVFAAWSDFSLNIAILEAQITACPDINLIVSVENESGPVTGIPAGSFTVSESGGNAFQPDSVNETGPGVYSLAYQTPSAHGGDVYPSVNVTTTGVSASDTGVYHNCTPDGAAIDVWMNRDHIGYREFPIIIPFRIEPIEIGFHVNSFEVDLEYDKNFLDFERVEQEGTLVGQWDQVVYNGQVSEKIFIAAANTQQLNLSADTDDILLALKFYVVEDAPIGECTEIFIRRMVFNNGTPLPVIQHGQVCIEPLIGEPKLADLRLRNQLTSADTVITGENLDFKITVTNDGPDPATNVKVRFAMDPQLSLADQEGDGSYDPERGIWTIGTIHKDKSAEIDISTVAGNPGSWSKTAEVRSVTEPDPDSTPNNDIEEEDDQETIAFTILPLDPADLSLTKTLDNPSPKLGETVTFTLTLENDGPEPAFGVAVTDRFVEFNPSPFTFISASGDGSFNEETGRWLPPIIEVGTPVSIDLLMRVDQLGSHTNLAEVTAAGRPDPDSTPNNRDPVEDDQDEVTLTTQQADLSLVVAVDDAAPNVGDTITFTVTLDQNGPNDCDAVAVSVPIPDSLTFLGAVTSGSFDGNSGLWNVGALGNGAQEVLEIQTRVDHRDAFTLTAQVSASDQGDPDSKPNNNIEEEDDQDSVNVYPLVADLSLTLSSDNPAPEPLQDFTITMTLHNEGPDLAQNIVVDFPLPGTVSVLAFDPGYSGGQWSAGDLGPGLSKTWEIDLRKGPSPGVLEFTAEVVAVDQNDPDSDPNNGIIGEDDDDAISLGAADLKVTLDIDEEAPTLTQEITATFTVTNDGPDPSGSSSFQIRKPSDLVWVGTTGDGTYDRGTGTWQPGPLTVGQSKQLQLTWRVYGISVKQVEIECMQADLLDLDSTPGNNQPGEDDQTSQSVTPDCVGGSTITVLYSDAPGSGFFDNTPSQPTGGNPGTTVGEQRRLAFEYALSIWESALSSNVDIIIEASMENLSCSATGGVLGSAGPKQVMRDFPGAALTNTWYPSALANALAGTDLAVGSADVAARFNAGIDNNNGCLSNVNWYYGLDQDAGTDLDFVSVVLHELGHGLGFLTLVNGSTGAKFMGRNDVFMQFLEDHGSGKKWSAMTDSERRISSVSTGNLHWTGDNIVDLAPTLDSGAHASGHVEMYAPSSYQNGSSVSHFSTSLSPNQLMEPSYTSPNHDVAMTLALFGDIGWGCLDSGVQSADLALSGQLSNPNPAVGGQVTLSLNLENAGPDQVDSIQVRYLIPEQLSYVSASGDGNYDSQTGIWQVDNLANNSQAQISIVLNVDKLELSISKAQVWFSSLPDPDSTPANNLPAEDDHVEIALTPRGPMLSDLSLHISASPLNPNPGDQVVIMLSVENQGPDDSPSAVVSYTVPDGLTYVSDDGSYHESFNEWSVGDVDAGEKAEVRITCTVDRAGGIVNTAEITWAFNNDPDSTPDNADPSEDDYASIRIFGQPNIADCSRCAQIRIVNLDEPGEGFNDPTPVEPIGGNTGTTLGQQRLIALEQAASEFCRYLRSDEEIVVHARFDELLCNETGAVTATASPAAVVRDFQLAPKAETWYPVALANALAGEDFNAEEPEIIAVFNTAPDLNPDPENPDDPDEDPCEDCTASSSNYQVEVRSRGRIKFENAPVGLGEDRTYMTDTFVIDVDTPTNSVKITIKASTGSVTRTLSGIGDSALFGALGFEVTLVNIEGSTYTFTVTAICNYHALSNIEFEFGQGNVTQPTNTYTADRLTCPELWNPDCEDPIPDNKANLFRNDHPITAPADRVPYTIRGAYFGRVGLAGINADGHIAIHMSRPINKAQCSGKRGYLVPTHETLEKLGEQPQLVYFKGSPQEPVILHMQPLNLLPAASKTSCLGGARWYYGLDRNAQGDLDFVTVALHELVHGLGFTTLVDLDSESATAGQFLEGYPDIMATLLEDHPTALSWDEMTEQERLDSAGSVGNLHWLGPLANEYGDRNLGSGLSNGHLKMESGSPVTTGKTAVHWSADLNPNQLMEAAYGGPNHDLELAAKALVDLGWLAQGCVDLELAMTVDNPDAVFGETVTYTLTVVNRGPRTGTDILVTAGLGSGLSYQSHSGDGSFDSGSGVWNIGSLILDQEAEIQISAEIAVGDRVLETEVTAVGQPDPDSIPNNRNPAEDDYARISLDNPTADLSLSHFIQETIISPSGLSKIRFTLSNSGPDTAEDLQVQISTDPQLTYQGHVGSGFDPQSGVWSLSELGAGSFQNLEYVFRGESLGTYNVQAEVISSAAVDPDSTPSNGSLAEDDLTRQDIDVVEPQDRYELDLLCIKTLNCPINQVEVAVTNNGEPVNGFTGDRFLLTEDGSIRPVTMETTGQDGIYLLSYESTVADGKTHAVDVRLLLPQRGGIDNFVYAFREFTNCNEAGCTQITANQPLDQLSGVAGSWRCFSIEVPANQASLTVDSLLGSGDADLFVKYGSQPTLNDYDFAPRKEGNQEKIEVAFPSGGTWYVGVYGFQEYCDIDLMAGFQAAQIGGEVTGLFQADCPEVGLRFRVVRSGQGVNWLTANDILLFEDGVAQNFTLTKLNEQGNYRIDYTTPNPDGESHQVKLFIDILGDRLVLGTTYENCRYPDCGELENNIVVSDLAGEQGSEQCYCLEVPTGQDWLEFKTFSGFGDSDLYLSRDAVPTTETYDHHPNVAGSEETIRIESPLAGNWCATIHGFTEYSDINLLGRYGRDNLSLNIEDIITDDCPLVEADVLVTAAGVPLTGLQPQAFQISENGGLFRAVIEHTELGEGRYRLRFETEYTDGREVFLVAGVEDNGKTAFDTEPYEGCLRGSSGVFLWLNDENCHPAGSIIDVPLLIGPVSPGHEIDSFFIEINYDPVILTYIGLENSGPASQWQFIDDSGTTPGQLRINAANFDGAVLENSAEEAELFILQFAIDGNADPGTTTDLYFNREQTLFNEDGDPRAVVEDGSVCISLTCNGALGDVDADGNAKEAFDALQIIRHAVEIPTVYDPIPLCVGDTNCSGLISIMDAVLVLQRATRLINGYCGGQTAVKVDDPFQIDIQVGEANIGESFDLLIRIDQLPFNPVYGYLLELEFDPQAVIFTGDVDTEGTLTARWGSPTVNYQAGRLILAHLNPYSPIEGLGDLVRLRGIALSGSGTTTISFNRFELAANSEPSQVPGDIQINLGNQPCFDLDAFNGNVQAWPNPGILTLVESLICPAP